MCYQRIFLITFFWLCLGLSSAFADDAGLIYRHSQLAANKPDKAKICKNMFITCGTNSLSKAKKQRFEITSKACKQEQVELNCAGLAMKEPKLKSKIRDCSAFGLCMEEAKQESAILKGCFWNAPKQLGIDLWNLIFETAALAKKKAGQCIEPKDLVDQVISVWQCQAPIYWAYSAYQDAPSPEKIYQAGKKWVEKQGVKLQCFDSEAQSEMICYGVLAVFAPDKIIKVGKAIPSIVKLVKLDSKIKLAGESRAKAIGSRASVQTARRQAGGSGAVDFIRNRASVASAQLEAAANLAKPVAQKSTVPTALTVKDSYTQKYVTKVITTEKQNQKWVDIATSATAEDGIKFFDVENSVLKSLNDVTLDKNFVTAMTNQHKELIKTRINSLSTQFPEVEFIVYSDFKSIRYAFKPKPPATSIPNKLETEVAKVFQQANEEFLNGLKSKNLVPEGQDANWWFRAGWGETADEASFATRFSRSAPDKNQMRKFTDSDLQENQKRTLDMSNLYRESLSKSLNDKNFFIESSISGKQVLKPEIFDAIRKTKTPEELKSFIETAYDQKIELTQAKQLRTYSEMVDEFSPGIHVVRREQAILDKPTGGINFDLVGAGSENAFATADALSLADSVESAVSLTRKGEQSVTAILNKRKKEVQDTVTPILKKHGITARFIASGDDMTLIPDKVIPAKVTFEITQAMAKIEKPASVRMSSVGSGIQTTTERMVLATQGESIEKLTRTYLQGQVPKNIADQVLVSIQVETKKVGTGNIRLLLGEGIGLTDAQRSSFQQAFIKAVENTKGKYKPVF